MAESILKDLENVKALFEEKGNTREVKKLFWKTISKIKRSKPNEINDQVVELASLLRDKLYPRKIVLSSSKGYAFALSGFILTFLLFLWILISVNFGFMLNTVIIFFAIFVNLYFTFLFGRCLGSLASSIRIEGFYMYDPLEFGIKMDYKTYLKASQGKRVLLFGTTIFFEVIVLLVETFIVFLINTTYAIVPMGILLIWVVGTYAIHKKARTGEMHRFLRELNILRKLKNKG